MTRAPEIRMDEEAQIRFAEVLLGPAEPNEAFKRAEANQKRLIREDTPKDYERRAIEADAQRAAKLGESPMKACSWNWKWYPENMRIWMDAYNRQLAEQDLRDALETDALSRAVSGGRHG